MMVVPWVLLLVVIAAGMIRWLKTTKKGIQVFFKYLCKRKAILIK